jgi:CspA family cold shock protein
MSITTDVTSSTSSERLTGRVKWFNNKAGYGFITVTDGSQSGSDIFIHHSAISVADQQYKYLVQGEYVSFQLTQTSSSQHPWQAAAVGGINSGKLMCETRNESRVVRSKYQSDRHAPSSETTQDAVAMPQQRRAPRQEGSTQRVARTRGEGPRESSEGDGGAWKLADPASSKPRRTRAPRSTVTSNVA